LAIPRPQCLKSRRHRISSSPVKVRFADVRFTPKSGHSPTRSGCLLWARNGHCAQRSAATFFNLPIHAHNALGTPASSTMCRAALNNRHGRNRWRRRKKSRPSRKSGTKVLRLGKEKRWLYAGSGETDSRPSRGSWCPRAQRFGSLLDGS
jgi:hypothetical protein